MQIQPRSIRPPSWNIHRVCQEAIAVPARCRDFSKKVKQSISIPDYETVRIIIAAGPAVRRAARPVTPPAEKLQGETASLDAHLARAHKGH